MVESRGMTTGCTASAASHMTCTNFSFVHIFVLSGSLRKSPYRLMKNALSRSAGSFGVCRMANNSCYTGSTFRLRSLRCLASGMTDDTDCCCCIVEALQSASDGVCSASSTTVSSTSIFVVDL